MTRSCKAKDLTAAERTEARQRVNAKHYALHREKITAHRRNKYEEDLRRGAIEEQTESKLRKVGLKVVDRKLKESTLRVPKHESKKPSINESKGSPGQGKHAKAIVSSQYSPSTLSSPRKSTVTTPTVKKKKANAHKDAKATSKSALRSMPKKLSPRKMSPKKSEMTTTLAGSDELSIDESACSPGQGKHGTANVSSQYSPSPLSSPRKSTARIPTVKKKSKAQKDAGVASKSALRFIPKKLSPRKMTPKKSKTTTTLAGFDELDSKKKSQTTNITATADEPSICQPLLHFTKDYETSESFLYASPAMRFGSLPPSSPLSSPSTKPNSRAMHAPVFMTRLNFSLEKARKIYAEFKFLCGDSRVKFFGPLYDEFAATYNLDNADAKETTIKLLCYEMGVRHEQIQAYAKPHDEDIVDEVLAYVCELDAWKEDIEDFNHFAFLGMQTLTDELNSGTIRRYSDEIEDVSLINSCYHSDEIEDDVSQINSCYHSDEIEISPRLDLELYIWTFPK
ncbi:hypothetical protein F5876DRAFT_69259 [Lentinula aff. lateritia]|uniref:Uncharacterized protein n=1 Tax=Lentinula aff. lateritia TaxID=2804960 RepID=A0ACC1TMV4_9AGAR|nr:hypothetical protein F5876DRAFT_69259 [Lentinula aff. lateritia]